ncbi:MAG: TrmH family RNA methyltransferase [Pseudomonadota bacterium]
MSIRLILYQPEIAANLGAILRISACFGAQVDVVEPCGFPWKTKDISRVAMDYANVVSPIRHASWEYFEAVYQKREPKRLILLTTKADLSHTAIRYQPGDHFIIGQESAGVPEAIHKRADMAVKIAMSPKARSLNMAVSGAVALSEARRQIGYDDIP